MRLKCIRMYTCNKVKFCLINFTQWLGGFKLILKVCCTLYYTYSIKKIHFPPENSKQMI